MILVDANLLVYSVVETVPQHPTAKVWLDDELSSGRRVGLPWVSLIAFMRLVGNPRIFPRALEIERSWSVVAAWLGLENVWTPEATDRHHNVLAALIPQSTGRHSLIHDAHLAALAIEHGLELVSADRDFARFGGLRWRNPLEA